MENAEILTYLSNILLGHEFSLKLLEDGKVIPAFRKMQGTHDKICRLYRMIKANEKDSDT